MKIRVKKFSNSGHVAKARLKLFSRRRRAIAVKESLASPVVRLPRTTVKLNIRGNRTGMHNADNSEHMKKVRAMRRFYNKQMPVLQCSSCSFASSCPKFRAGFECAFLPFLNSHRISNEHDLLESMQELCSTGMRRAHLATIMETLTGAAPSLETSESLNLVFAQLKALHELQSGGNIGVTVETEDETIIGKLFGGLDKLIDHTQAARANPIDVPVVHSIADKQEFDVFTESSSNPNVNLELIRDHSRSELETLKGKKHGEIQVSEVKI